jgi:CHASE1-domain containing sensor protein
VAKTKLSFAIALVRRNSVPLVVLALSLLGVLWMWHDDRRAARRPRTGASSGLARDLAANLAAEMRMHEQMLRGAAGLLESSSKVSRATFHSYVERLALQPRFPGILSVGYAEQLTGSAIGVFEHSIRGSDYAEFQIHPPGKRALYVPVIYVEPSTSAESRHHRLRHAVRTDPPRSDRARARFRPHRLIGSCHADAGPACVRA